MRVGEPIEALARRSIPSPAMRRVAIVALLGVLVSSCVGRPDADASGEEIYLQLCSNCHGDQLEGGIGPPLGAGSNAAEQPDQFLHVTITQGRGRMPSFSSSLTDDQVGRLIDYLREAQAG
jgi:mono/diheme cytochrome c family protein